MTEWLKAAQSQEKDYLNDLISLMMTRRLMSTHSVPGRPKH